VGLDEPDHGCVEARREVADLLEHDPTRLEHRRGGSGVQAERRAVHVNGVGIGLGLATIEHYPAGL
jgi:hypothetical protein